MRPLSFFGNGEVFTLLDMIVKALQELLIMQKHLTGFKYRYSDVDSGTAQTVDHAARRYK